MVEWKLNSSDISCNSIHHFDYYLDIFNDDCRGKLQDQELSGVGQHAVHDLAAGLAAARIGKILTLIDWDIEL